MCAYMCACVYVSFTSHLPPLTLAAKQLLQLDPVSTLLEREHVDKSLQQLHEAPLHPMEGFAYSEITLALPHDLGSRLSHSINQHGSVSRLPPKLTFTSVNVTKTTITLHWSPTSSTTHTDATNLTYDLQCYMDLPKGFPQKTAMAKMINPLHAPSRESGFEEGSMGPSGSVSMVTVGSSKQFGSSLSGPHPTGLGVPLNAPPTPHSGVPHMVSSQPIPPNVASLHIKKDGDCLHEEEDLTPCGSSYGASPVGQSVLDSSVTESNRTGHLVDSSGRGKGVKHLFSDTIRLPQPTSSQHQAPPTNDFSSLNLPPLIHHQRDEDHSHPKSTNEIRPTSTLGDVSEGSESSGVLGDVEDFGRNVTSSLSNSRTGTALGLPPLRKSPSNLGGVVECDPMEGACVGMQFEQVYTGSKGQYTYSGVIVTATYYFKVRCRNNTGWGPWSSVIKCSSNKRTK